jgi:hypothetical protein
MQLYTEDQALMFRAACGAFARRMSRKTRSALAAEYRADLAALDRQILSGGPRSKDELVSALVELHYPAATLNMTSHVLYHDGGGWSACAWCGGQDATDADRAQVELADRPQ